MPTEVTISPHNDEQTTSVGSVEIDGAKLVRNIERIFTKYAVLPGEGIPLVLASWALSTWMMRAFDTHPLLAITSPTKQCGKSRVLELLALVSRRPITSANMSPAVLYRIIEESSPTLLIDEAQALQTRDDRSAALVEILSASYRRSLAYVHRMGGKQMDEVRKFKVFTPKALALIGNLTDVLADRSIELRMKRRAPKEHVAPFDYRRVRRKTKNLRKQIRQWAKDHSKDVRHASWKMKSPAGLEDRDAELWRPLFAVVSVADPGRLPQLEKIARTLTAKKAADDSAVSIQLLRDCRAAFKKHKASFLHTQTLLGKLIAQDGSWSEFKNGQPLSAAGLARILKPFEIKPRRIRKGKILTRGYARTGFKDTWNRYLKDE